MPGAAKILIVEDDAHIRRLLRATTAAKRWRLSTWAPTII